MSSSAKASSSQRTKGKEQHPTKWTSWEGHNYVLIGLVDELISLGVDPSFKFNVLQIWARYLSKLEVAFTSKTEKLLPKFGVNQTAKDHQIIHGFVPKKKEKPLVVHLNYEYVNASDSDITDDFINLEIDSALDDSVLNEIFNESQILYEATPDPCRPDISNEKPPSEIEEKTKDKETNNHSNSARTSNESMPGPSFIATDDTGAGIFHQAKKVNVKEDLEEGNSEIHSDSFLHKKFRPADAMALTRLKLLAVLGLALLYSREYIQISDMLRWIREGHLSYYNVLHLFPKHMQFGPHDDIFSRPPPNVRYKAVQICMVTVAKLLGIVEFPRPNLLALTRRYIHELQLPTNLLVYVERAMAAWQLNSCEEALSYEGIAMSFVIVALKMTLGLDGLTERTISDVAKKVNSLKHSKKSATLFVWDDWVRYIECRKAVTLEEHFPTKVKYGRGLFTKVGPRADYWNKNEAKCQQPGERRPSRRPANIATKASYLKLVEEMPDSEPFAEAIQFPPSLTPMCSYLENILAHWSAYGLGDPHSAEILTYDHTQTSVEYLYEPDRVIKFARKQGIDIEIKETRAPQNVSFLHVKSLRTRRPKTFKDTVTLQITDEEELDGVKRTKIEKHLKRKLAKVTLTDDDEPPANVDKNRIGPKTFNKSYDGESSSCIERVTLFRPFRNYWIFNIHPDQPDTSFESDIEPNLPDSFSWLLKECSFILEMKPVELYEQVRLVENLCLGDIEVKGLKITVSKRL